MLMHAQWCDWSVLVLLQHNTNLLFSRILMFFLLLFFFIEDDNLLTQGQKQA